MNNTEKGTLKNASTQQTVWRQSGCMLAKSLVGQ